MKTLSVTVDEQCRKTSTSNLSLAQNSSDNALILYAKTKYANVRVTFRFPTGNLFYELHMAYMGYDDDTSCYKYGLAIPYAVTNFTIPSATARMSVSFHCWAEDDTSRGGGAVCDTAIVVNKSSNSEVYDPSYNGTDIENLWRFLGQLSAEITSGKSVLHIVSALPNDVTPYEDGTIFGLQTSSELSFYRLTSGIITSMGYGLVTVKAKLDDHSTRLSSAEATITSHTKELADIASEEGTHIHIKEDADGNVYADYSNVSLGSSVASSQLINRADAAAIIANLATINTALVAYAGLENANSQEIGYIENGNKIVGHASLADRATNDSDGHPIYATKYGCKVTLTYSQSDGKLTAHLFNQANDEVSSATYDLPTELIFDNQGYDATRKVLWFHPTGKSVGDNVEIDVTDLFDVYKGSDNGTILIEVKNNVITATIDDGSITLEKLSTALKSTIDGWATAESNRVSAEAIRSQNETARQLAESARVTAENARAEAEAKREANYTLYRDADGRVCCQYDNLKVVG